MLTASWSMDSYRTASRQPLDRHAKEPLGLRMDIVLFEPEIPPNTGNIMRLCANFGARLHLIEPLGFELDDRRLRRAGLDYRDLATVRVHPGWIECRAALGSQPIFGFSTHGKRNLGEASLPADAALLFGPETRGLPAVLRTEVGPEHLLRIPMQADSRSLNLANAVAIACFEMQRQLGFPGLG